MKPFWKKAWFLRNHAQESVSETDSSVLNLNPAWHSGEVPGFEILGEDGGNWNRERFVFGLEGNPPPCTCCSLERPLIWMEHEGRVYRVHYMTPNLREARLEHGVSVHEFV